MDWDKLRVFYATVDAGSFTHAAAVLDVNQSSVSRQIRTLEEELGVTLFHRHARGLTLTEQGELLYRTVQDVFNRLQTVQTRMSDSKGKPFGELRITTPVGLGALWLTPRLPEFRELYPDIKLRLLLDNTELDLTKGEADVAIWLRAPTQADLIQRRLFTVHLHLYASTDCIKAVDLNHRRARLALRHARDLQPIELLDRRRCATERQNRIEQNPISLNQIFDLSVCFVAQFIR